MTDQPSNVEKLAGAILYSARVFGRILLGGMVLAFLAGIAFELARPATQSGAPSRPPLQEQTP